MLGVLELLGLIFIDGLTVQLDVLVVAVGAALVPVTETNGEVTAFVGGVVSAVLAGSPIGEVVLVELPEKHEQTDDGDQGDAVDGDTGKDTAHVVGLDVLGTDHVIALVDGCEPATVLEVVEVPLVVIHRDPLGVGGDCGHRCGLDVADAVVVRALVGVNGIGVQPDDVVLDGQHQVLEGFGHEFSLNRVGWK